MTYAQLKTDISRRIARYTSTVMRRSNLTQAGPRVPDRTAALGQQVTSAPPKRRGTLAGPALQRGFTIVELLIVIVVIAILAAISIVAYTGIQERARFSAMRSELASINKAIQLYYAENGSYPITPPDTATGSCSGSWCGFYQATGDNFIPGLSPTYISNIPQMPSDGSRNNTYVYRSPNGADYKLIRLANGLSDSEQSAMADLRTTDCSAFINSSRWGYWSSDTSKCW